MTEFLPFVWVLIPLAAIAVGAFKEWLKFKAKQDRLGTSAAQLEKAVESLREDLERSEESRRRVVQRLQNLETIVTAEMWDVVHGEGERSAQATRPRKPVLELPEDEDETADQVSRIADRLRNM